MTIIIALLLKCMFQPNTVAPTGTSTDTSMHVLHVLELIRGFKREWLIYALIGVNFPWDLEGYWTYPSIVGACITIRVAYPECSL